MLNGWDIVVLGRRAVRKQDDGATAFAVAARCDGEWPRPGDLGNGAIADLDLPLGELGNLFVVSNHDYRPPLGVELLEQRQHAGLVF